MQSEGPSSPRLVIAIMTHLPRRLFLTAGSVAGLQLTLTGLSATLGGCDGSTTGRRTVFETVAQSDVAAGEAFDNAFGWTIELAEAWICLGYLRYAEGRPLARRAPSLSRLLLREAQAHPGHYDEGLTIGEMRTPQLVDLLGPAQSLGSEPGVSGDAQSALVRFHAGESVSAPVPEAVAYVRGIARREGVEQSFTAVAERDQVLNSVSGEAEIPGCPLDGGPLDHDGVILLEVRLRLWLDQVDFELVPDGAEPALVAGEPPHSAFLRGVQKAAAYSFHYDPA